MLYTNDRINDMVDNIRGNAAVLTWVLFLGGILVFIIISGVILVARQM